jgi:charged multivesicular body protein 5
MGQILFSFCSMDRSENASDLERNALINKRSTEMENQISALEMRIRLLESRYNSSTHQLLALSPKRNDALVKNKIKLLLASRKMNYNSLNQTNNLLIAVLTVKSAIETTNMNYTTMVVLKNQKNLMKQLIKNMDAEKVEEIMMDIQELMATSDEVSESLSNTNAFKSEFLDISEEQLELELEELSQSEDMDILSILPRVPIADIKEKDYESNLHQRNSSKKSILSTVSS